MSGERVKTRIAIVTPGYLSSTPRVVREADTLTSAGYDVRVVCTRGPLEQPRSFDQVLVAGRAWRCDAVGWSRTRVGERALFWRSGVRHRMAQRASPGPFDLPGVAERGEGRTYPELARLAAREPAALFIGHYPTGLAAAAVAARRHGARLGYDIEDLYAETYPPSAEWQRPSARIVTIERRYVPECLHLTAASGLMAEEFARRYRTAVPVAIYNCHPWSDRATLDGRRLERVPCALSLFWFSQTVGLDRGLQDAIRAAAGVADPVHIHLRGAAAPDVRATLERLAEEVGFRGRLHFHEPCRPEELLARGAEHDVGLALETEDSLNRRVTVTNKVFLYLTAGLAVAASDVPGQRAVADAEPDAFTLYRPGDVETLRRHLTMWARDAAALAHAKQVALDAARTRWNAEREGERLVAAVARSLAAPTPAHAASA